MTRSRRQALREKFRWAVMSPERRLEVVRKNQEAQARSRYRSSDRGFTWKDK